MKTLVFCLFLLLSPSLLAVNLTDSNTLFDWAEKQYPQLFFPAGQISQEQYGWQFRYYPGSKNYVGVRVDGDVYVMGDTFGGLVRIDTLQALLAHIAGSQRVNTPAPGEDDWELIVDRGQINTLLLSDDGKTLWVGSYGGLEQRDSASGQLEQASLAGSKISLLETDGSGGFCAVIDDQLAHRNANGAWSTDITADSGLPKQVRITALKNDGSNGLWVGSSDGLSYRKANGEWTIYTRNVSLSLLYSNSWGPKSVYDLAQDSRGGLWILTNEGLTYRNMSGELTTYTSENSGLSGSPIRTIKSDNSGGLWIGTTDDLTYRNMSGEWTTYTSDNSGLPSGTISNIEIDANGAIWVLTQTKKSYYEVVNSLVQRSVHGEWTVYTSDNSGLPDEFISAINNNGLWIIHSGELTHYSSSGKWTTYTSDNSELPEDFNWQQVTTDGLGGVWFGSIERFTHLDASGNWTSYTIDNTGSSLMQLKSDEGGLWVWLRSGNEPFYSLLEPADFTDSLAYLSVNGEWTTYPTIYKTNASGLPRERILAIEKDGSNGLWISTERIQSNAEADVKSYSLIHLNINGVMTEYTSDNSGVPLSGYHTLKSDDRRGLWLGNGYSLTYRSASDEWTTFTRDNSLLPISTGGIFETDGNSGLWMMSSGKLAHLTFSQ